MRNFENRLKGGHPNSLGNTIEVVEEVLKDHALFDELFNCYFSEDELVRLRTSNAMKRVAKESKQLLMPYIDRLISEIAKIDQASTQWTLAQLFKQLESVMSPSQIRSAKKILKRNLEQQNDWIVLNTTMETLVEWAKSDKGLAKYLLPHLKRISTDSRKSVANRAKKGIITLTKT